ncbi:uncharacterized protein [Antedon mediterranea]|uniref:uncharacterized protein n=1 Tax=Antedon mediterranea TaxID=105859 RepID=UPI003AF78965
MAAHRGISLLVIFLLFLQTTAQEIQEVMTFPHCPVCCERGDPGSPGNQGLPGSQGVPGAPGIHGLHGEPGAKGEVGSMGFKGRKGERGPKGERGEIGIPTAGGVNLKGDPGQKGAKGEIGTRGSEGRSGDQGVQGSKGSKGQKGKKGPSAVTPVPAFFVKQTQNFVAQQEQLFIFDERIAKRSIDEKNLTEESTISRQKRQFVDVDGPILLNPGGRRLSNVIPFDTVIVNEENGWKEKDYIFEAPSDGTYLFSFTIYKLATSKYVAALLYKNFEVLAATEDQGTSSDSATMTAVVDLRKSEFVWLQLAYPGTLLGNGNTFFSGLKIH